MTTRIVHLTQIPCGFSQTPNSPATTQKAGKRQQLSSHHRSKSAYCLICKILSHLPNAGDLRPPGSEPDERFILANLRRPHQFGNLKMSRRGTERLKTVQVVNPVDGVSWTEFYVSNPVVCSVIRPCYISIEGCISRNEIQRYQQILLD